MSAEFVTSCIVFARERAQSTAISPTDTNFSDLSLVDDYASSASSDWPQYQVSKAEATFYYAGISPAPPKLVYRTGVTPWVKPTGLEAYRRLKQARGVFGHKLNVVWDDVGPKVRDLLSAQSVAWTSIDVVRFITDGDGDKKINGPVVIWVGVFPNSLGGEDAFTSSKDILDLLAINGITDVEVEYRESVYTPSVGPELLSSVSNLNNTVDVRGPLTTALGLQIAASDRQDAQGTMGLYLAEDSSSDKILGLTCRHVLFKADENANDDYVFAGSGAPRKNVQLLGTRAFAKLLDSIKMRIGGHGIDIQIYEEQIPKLQAKLEAGNEEAGQEIEETEILLGKARKAIVALEEFYKKVKSQWGPPKRRIIGHIRSSPGITFNAGPEGYTEDWGVFELDNSKFKAQFRGNFMDLGAFRLYIPGHLV